MNKKIIVLTIGIAGSGKSSYLKLFAKTHNDAIIISQDVIRQNVANADGIVFIKENEPIVKKLFLSRIKNSLNSKFDYILIDETNHTKKIRNEIFQLLDNVNLIIIEFNNFRMSLLRNYTRDRVVPFYAIDRMIKEFESFEISELINKNISLKQIIRRN